MKTLLSPRKTVSHLIYLAIVIWAVVLSFPHFGSAQLLLVTSEYRVVVLDKPQQRIGIALREADPTVRQNWLYVKATTDFIIRRHNREGYTKEERVNYDTFFSLVRKGDIISVHGGRDWDGSIDAKRVVLDLPPGRSASTYPPNIALPSTSSSQGQTHNPTYIYFDNYEWKGVVKDRTTHSILLQDKNNLSVLLPQSLQYQKNDRWVNGNTLQPGDRVTALVPGGKGELLSANYLLVTLKSPPALLQIPYSHLPKESLKSIYVPVVEADGSSTNLAMDHAMDLVRLGQGVILDWAYHRPSSWFPAHSGHALLLEVHPKFVVLAVVTPNGIAVKRLSASKAGALNKMTPGSAVAFTPRQGALLIYQWAQGEVCHSAVRGTR